MHVYFILCPQFILLGGVHVWHSQNLRGNVPFDYRAFCSELTFKLTPTCFQAASFTFRLSGAFALKWIFHWTGKTLAFHFNVLTALSICIASEAEFVKICKQQNPMCFSRADPVFWGRLSLVEGDSQDILCAEFLSERKWNSGGTLSVW